MVSTLLGARVLPQDKRAEVCLFRIYFLVDVGTWRLGREMVEIMNKRTYQCLLHKRYRANRTLYKTENIRKLPDFINIFFFVIIIVFIINQEKRGFSPHRTDPEQETGWSTKATRQGELSQEQILIMFCCPSHGHAVAHKNQRVVHNTHAHIPMSSRTQRAPSIFEVIAIA
jgi:hypothetical protein